MAVGAAGACLAGMLFAGSSESMSPTVVDGEIAWLGLSGIGTSSWLWDLRWNCRWGNASGGTIGAGVSSLSGVDGVGSGFFVGFEVRDEVGPGVVDGRFAVPFHDWLVVDARFLKSKSAFRHFFFGIDGRYKVANTGDFVEELLNRFVGVPCLAELVAVGFMVICIGCAVFVL